MTSPQPRDLYARYARAVAGYPLPTALVDLDALERNIDTLAAPARASGKRLRVASKSLRSIELLHRIAARLGEHFGGVMAYSASEAAFLVSRGFRDVLLAYPSALAADARALAEANRDGASVTVVIDDPEHLVVLDAAARAADTRIPVVIELDLALRAAGGRVHLGVRRSPLREPAALLALAERVRALDTLVLRGVMGYESQIAGLGDHTPHAPWNGVPTRVLKKLSARAVVRAREAAVLALRGRGYSVELVNGGGTGSLAWNAGEAVLTELTAGSGFLVGHLFDHYRGLAVEPALFFALQIVRRPAPGWVTCAGGGYIASGACGPDRAPQPWLPSGLSLAAREGAGEVQTPLRVPARVGLGLGDPVFFRPAKSGELAEHFARYLLVRGASVEGEAATYRGEGRCFL